LFVAAVGLWLRWSEAQELDDERRTLITDALSLESRLSDWVRSEQGVLGALARVLPPDVDDQTLLRLAPVVEGLRRQWISVTVLGAGNRLQAHAPQQSPRPVNLPAASGVDDGGLSAHLVAPVPSGGWLIVRFAPASLLRQSVPWWLARKYDVRLVDSAGQLIAGPSEALPAAGRQSHVLSLEPALNDTYLELTTREVHTPGWHTLPSLLMAVFLLLTAAATWTLRRQMLDVARAEASWFTEAAWRRAIEDSLTVGLRGRDMQGRLIHVNRAFCDLIGFAPEQLLGQMPPMPYWPRDTVAESMQRHRRNMAGRAPRDGYETHWVRRDGTPIDVMIFEAPLVDALGQQVGWMGSIVDITARKRAEERERRQVETLAHQARLTTLGEVASALAHQLNQPLTAIAGYNAGVLRMLERAGYADDMVLDAVRRLGEQASEAGRIVQRIREFLTRRSPQREPCELRQIIDRALGLLRRDLQRHRVEVETDLADDLPLVMADPVLMEQVVINLVRNALDEMTQAASPSPRVRISARPAGPRFLRVDVDDSGPGLGGCGIEQLCTPFYSTKAEGMGMGLAICRSVVEAHFGGMEAGVSALGGARLSFTLPVVDGADA
jgi:two-component system sensor histidine kinase DctS